jgi:hypothetical protein
MFINLYFLRCNIYILHRNIYRIFLFYSTIYMIIMI